MNFPTVTFKAAQSSNMVMVRGATLHLTCHSVLLCLTKLFSFMRKCCPALIKTDHAAAAVVYNLVVAHHFYPNKTLAETMVSSKDADWSDRVQTS